MFFKLKVREKIPKKDSHEMIQLMAISGNHRYNIYSETEVIKFYEKNNYRYDKLVRNCRDFNNDIPFFEITIGYKYSTIGGATIEKRDPITKEMKKVKNGTMVISTYLDKFNTSYELFKESIEKFDFSRFQTACTTGITSIDSFIKNIAAYYNKHNPDDTLIDDKEHKVSTDEKIKIWIPKMLNVVGINLDIIYFSHFIDLENIRDKFAVHPKEAVSVHSYKEQCREYNKFKTGIGGFLVYLHKIFGIRIPCIIIRASFFPEIELVEYG